MSTSERTSQNRRLLSVIDLLLVALPPFAIAIHDRAGWMISMVETPYEPKEGGSQETVVEERRRPPQALVSNTGAAALTKSQ